MTSFQSTSPRWWTRPGKAALLAVLLVGLLLLILFPLGCSSVTSAGKLVAPSNWRQWSPEMTKLAYATFEGDSVTVHNVRNCQWVSDSDYILRHYDKTYRLADVQSVDFIMIPFENLPDIAHTMLSFGFAGGDYLTLSVETRKEEGETYGPLKGFFRQYELIYVLGDERDVIRQCSNFRTEDVYLYRGRATPDQARTMLVDVLRRANKLVDEPEFYNTLTNNCTTNIVRHVNHVAPNRIPYSVEVLLPGLSDRLAYNLGLIEPHGTFEETKARAKINELAKKAHDEADFSRAIRR